MSKGKVKVIAITLLTLFVVTFAWANYTNSRGLTFDNSGNLLVANGGILAYINSYGFPLDSSGNILVNCATGCGAGTPAFSALTSGTNSTAAMIIGTGSSLTVSGSGTNVATGLTGSPAITVSSCTGCGGAFADPGSNGTMFRSALNTATVVNGSAVNQVYVAGTSGTGTPSYKSIGDLTPGTYVAGGGTAQAQTATFVPAVTALTAGLQLQFLPTAANTAAAPTLAANGLTATAITKCGTAALAAGDIATGQPAEVVYDGTEFVLSNPQAIPCGASQTTASVGFININNGASNSSANAANSTKIWAIDMPKSLLSSTKVVVNLTTADATGGDLYNIAIFNSAGNIVCQTGAQSSTTLAFTTTGIKTLSWTSTCGPLLSAQRYYVGVTGNVSVAVLGGASTGIVTGLCGAVPSSNFTTASAVWTTPIGVPADSAGSCTVPGLGLY